MTFTALIAIYLFSSFIGTCIVTFAFGLSNPLPDRRKSDRRIEARIGHVDRRASYNVAVELKESPLLTQE